MTPGFCLLEWWRNDFHPRRPREKLVGRKGRTKVFKYGRKSPWVPTLIELFPKIQADAGSYYYYYCAQSANSFSWVIFMSSYATPIVWPHSARFRSPSLCVQGKLLFSSFLIRNKGTADESKKRLSCFVVFDGSQLRCGGDAKVK